MGIFTPKKSLKRYTARVLNFLLLFSLIVPNVLSPAIVIAQELNIEQEESTIEIPIDESEDILEEGISTSIFEQGVYTVSLVEEKEYVYPDDDRVRIRFTSITEEGNLVIQKVLLSEEEKLSLNTTDEFGWSFTSTMSNGSFTYDLVLPNEQGDDIEVKYTEDGNTYTSIDQPLVNEGIVKILGLNHFTTFVVVPSGTIPAGVTEGTTEVDSTCNVSIGSGTYCYDTIQEAITASNNGDTINVLAGEYEISDTIVINKELTIIGASGAKLINIDTPAKTVFSITSSNVSIEGFEITHENSFPTDHKEVLYALISIPDNTNISNIEIKNNLIYGFYPSGTAHKDMHTRGITVGSNGGTNIDITNNTIHSVRNGIVVRPTNITNTNDNTIYNTKGGIMLYSSSFVDADNKTILNNTWTDVHNEWDIVWNSATYGFPDYQQSVIALGELNNDAFILDLRRETSTVVANLEGNRNPVFVTTAGVDKVHQSTGNMNEPFATVQFAIDKVVDNGTIYIGDGTFPEIGQIVIDKNLNILGSGTTNTIIEATGDTTSSGDGRGWILIPLGFNLNLQDLTLDGVDNQIYQGIRAHGTGFINNVIFKNIIYSKYLGTAIAFMGTMTIQNSHFENIGRQGMFAFGSIDNKLINNTYVGKGDGDWLDYGIEVGGGAKVEIKGNTISNCTGVASSDNSHSGAILISTYYGDGSAAEIYENEMYDNYYGVIVGYNEEDTSVVSAYHNNIFDNDYGFRSTTQEVEAQNNWWGHHTGPSGEASGLGDKVSENILYQEWLCEPYFTEWTSENGVCKLQTPETLGWNVSSLTTNPGKTPPVLSCGSYTNDNTPSHVWSEIDGENIKYQRQAKTPTGGWWTDPTVYTDTNTPFVWFGNQTNGIEGQWNTRVRAWVDTNENGTLDNTDLTSDWSNECKITYDKTAPDKPVGLERRALDNTKYQCGDIAQLQTLIPDWDDNTETDFSHYEYTSFNPNGSIGINEQKLFTSEFIHSWVPTVEGTYGYAVRAVDMAGNKSPWSLSDKTLEGSCQITYDSTGPEAPSIIFPTEGQYFNSKPILNDWTDVSDPSGIKEYEIKYLTPNGEILRKTVSSQRNHTPNISAQGEITIWVRAIDNVGNEGAWSDPVHYYYDITAPELPELIAPDNMSFVKGAVLTNSWSEITDADYYEYESYHNESLTNLRWYQEVNGTSKTAYNVAESTFWWRVRAVDLAGNKSAWTDAWKVTIDNTSPTTESISDFTINEGSTIPTKEVLAEDNYELDEFCYSITSDIGDVSETCISPSTTTNSWNIDLTDTILTELSNTYGITTTTADTSLIPEGDYTISYHSTDKAGNESSPHTFIVTIENVLPLVLFSSSTTEILEGNTVTFNGSFTDPGLNDSDWTYTLDFGDLSTQSTGSVSSAGTVISNLVHTYTDAGDYTASLEVCEDGGVICTTETIEITVGEVQGVTTGGTTTTNSPTLVKKVTTFVANILGVGGEGDALALEEEENLENDEEVKGSQTCDNPSTISGYIYTDSNENGEKDEKERVFPEISIRVYTITEGMEETVKQIVSDENGYWETTLCIGDYYISIDDSKLPNNYVLGENDQLISVEEEKDSTLNFEVLDERNFLQKYWPWILLALGVLGSIGIVVLDTRRKKEYI